MWCELHRLIQPEASSSSYTGCPFTPYQLVNREGNLRQELETAAYHANFQEEGQEYG